MEISMSTNAHFTGKGPLLIRQMEHQNFRSLSIGTVGAYSHVLLFMDRDQAQQLSDYVTRMLADWGSGEQDAEERAK
jgi:hypothetical protein